MFNLLCDFLQILCPRYNGTVQVHGYAMGWLLPSPYEEPFHGGQKGLKTVSLEAIKLAHSFSRCNISFSLQESMGQFQRDVKCVTHMFLDMTSAVGAVPCKRRR